MGQFDGVSGSSSGCKRSTKSKHESASHELSSLVSRSLDSSTDQDNSTADKDTDSSAVSIGKEATKWKGSNLSQVIDDEDKTS